MDRADVCCRCGVGSLAASRLKNRRHRYNCRHNVDEIHRRERHCSAGFESCEPNEVAATVRNGLPHCIPASDRLVSTPSGPEDAARTNLETWRTRRNRVCGVYHCHTWVSRCFTCAPHIPFPGPLVAIHFYYHRRTPAVHCRRINDPPDAATIEIGSRCSPDSHAVCCFRIDRCAQPQSRKRVPTPHRAVDRYFLDCAVVCGRRSTLPHTKNSRRGGFFFAFARVGLCG